MKQSRKEENGTCRRQTVDSLSCRSALLLSVVCCIALIHVELRIQEHHRLISSSVTHCDQMEKKILQKVQGNNENQGIRKDSHIKGQLHQTRGRHWILRCYTRVVMRNQLHQDIFPKVLFFIKFVTGCV